MGLRLPTEPVKGLIMRFGKRKNKWAIVTSAPKGEAGKQWGDYWFANDLAAALVAQGALARVVSRAGANSPARDDDDVVLVLRGLRRVVPSNASAKWLLWVISHPELVEPDEAAQFDHAFAASSHWSAGTELGTFTPLLQATNTERFVPLAHPMRQGVLFIGSTRGEFRPIVRDALAQKVPLTLYGVGWNEFVPESAIAGDFLSNAELPAAYGNAALVLNDHHGDMARSGFLSNRLFDAVSAGARVVSDPALGLKEVFGSTVVEYTSPAELAAIVRSPESYFDESRMRVDRERVRRENSFAARARTLMAVVADRHG